MGEQFRQLKWEDRVRLETLLLAGHNKSEIARIMNIDRSTVYNEIKRGSYKHLNKDYTESIRYSPAIAQKKCDENLKVRGTQLKIGNDILFADYLEDRVVNEGYSPAAVLGELKEQGREDAFTTSICVTTFYSYIDKGIFLRLTNKELPVKKKKKRTYHKVQRRKRAAAGESIEARPEEIDDRCEFGHWEMDSVIGKRGKSRNTLLVLTERKTRAEIIFKQPDKTADAVVCSLNRLEEKWGSELFCKVFKTITVDNGTEFSDCAGIEWSAAEGKNRTKVYYCHPFSSWERGSNENANKLVRRHIPKGTNFDDMPEEEIQRIEDWMNRYPRRILGYRSAGSLFQEELAALM